MTWLFPWISRIREAQKKVDEAQRGYEDTLAQFPDAECLARDLREHRMMNGWTSTIQSIFGGV